jgi:hypothetical protein
MSRFEVRRAAKLKALAEVGPLVGGSLCRVKRRCGNPHCKCARGEPHWAYALSFKVKGKTRTVHVPKEMVTEVQGWVREYRRVKRLRADISRNSLAILHRHVPTSRAGGRSAKDIRR